MTVGIFKKLEQKGVAASARSKETMILTSAQTCEGRALGVGARLSKNPRLNQGRASTVPT